MNSEVLCPICEEGSLTAHIGQNEIEYKDNQTILACHFSICNSCGAEQANAQQMKINKRLMAAFKKEVDGLLTGAQVRAIRKNLGLKQSDAARIFGGGPVAFSKYESDDITQSDAMDRLLRVASKVPDAFSYLVHKAKIPV